MRVPTSSIAVRVIVAFVVTVGLLLGPARTASSHDPLAMALAEAERHAELNTAWEDHGHSHDDGTEDEQSPGHTHGHNPSDHSHETPDQPPRHYAPLPALSRDWHAVAFDLPAPQAVPDFTRPPRPIFVA